MTPMLFGLHRPVEGLTVLGEATRDASPEIIEICFEVHSTAASAVLATQENASRIMLIRQACTPGGDQVELFAGAVAVWPIVQPQNLPFMFVPPPSLLPATASAASTGMMPVSAAITDPGQLIVYHACCPVKITVRDSAHLGEVLDTITRSGALPAGSIRFHARNERELRRVLLEQAVQDARDKADALAAAAGKTTGNAVSISEDFASYLPQYGFGNGHGMTPFGSGQFTGSIMRSPFSPGQLTFCARVFVTYQLQ